ncbi:LytTR family DNA-binding domain-containing protein [Carnobacterium gallinarum]|uniref:LytTR family DNA-binding domain-containing protein n=1 Tax=Carnobacterium gallinarum TaxID=2749 RepID=UPI00054F952F|nr:LytTR family DNA-binding domain-containing protein [Carnobacterium gallinarum]
MKLLFKVNSKLPQHTIEINTHPAEQKNWPNIEDILKQSETKMVLINVKNNRKVQVNQSQIIAIESEGRMCNVSTETGETFLLASRLKQIEETNTSDAFLKINNHTIINKNFIKEFHSCGNAKIELILNNQTRYFVSRHYLKNFRRHLR